MFLNNHYQHQLQASATFPDSAYYSAESLRQLTMPGPSATVIGEQLSPARRHALRRHKKIIRLNVEREKSGEAQQLQEYADYEGRQQKTIGGGGAAQMPSTSSSNGYKALGQYGRYGDYSQRSHRSSHTSLLHPVAASASVFLCVAAFIGLLLLAAYAISRLLKSRGSPKASEIQREESHRSIGSMLLGGNQRERASSPRLVLYPKRIYELQAEEGFCAGPPSLQQSPTAWSGDGSSSGRRTCLSI